MRKFLSFLSPNLVLLLLASQHAFCKLQNIDIVDNDNNSHADANILLENDYVRFTFTDATQGFSLVNVTSKNPQCKSPPCSWSFLYPQVQYAPTQTFWQAEFRDRVGRGYYVDNTANSKRSFQLATSANSTTLTLIWENIDLGYQYNQTNTKITATITLGANDTLGYFNLKVENPRNANDDNPCLISISYVTVINIAPIDGKIAKDVLAVPNTLGRLFPNPGGNGLSYSSSYPITNFAMQFMTFCHENDCLYYGTHDPSAYYKYFTFIGDAWEGVGNHMPLSTMYATHYPGNACVAPEGGSIDPVYEVPYPVVFGVFQGDWWDGTQIYRDWVLENAEWTEKGPLKNRDDFPKWFLDVPLWVNSGWEGNILNSTEGDPDIVVPKLIKLIETFNFTNLACHWYCWHDIPFDTDYPDYFPAKPGFKEAVAQLQDIGVHIVPYINGRLYDFNAETWEQDNAEEFCTKKSGPRLYPRTLQPYVESYGSGQNFAVMCPYTQFWQNRIPNIVGNLIDNFEVSGVYIDEIAAAGAAPCSDPGHGHSTGGGDYWYHGYETLLDNAHHFAHDSGRNRVLFTEANSEVYMKHLNGYLILSAFETCNLIPMFNAVYGGYIVPFGRVFFAFDFDDPNRFTAKIGQMLVYGAQLGWMSLGGSYNLYDQLIDPQYKPQIEYVKTAAQYRTLGTEWLLNGRMMRPLNFIFDPVIEVESECIYLTVVGNVWLNDAGDKLGIIITNAGNVTETVTIYLMPQDYTFSGTGTFTLSLVTPDEVTKIMNFDGSAGLDYKFSMSPLSVALYQITQ